MALLTPEQIIRRVVSIYEDNYATSLAAVQSSWQATEDITLTNFIDRVITANPDVLPKVWDDPLMQCNIGPIEGVEGESSQQYHDLYECNIQCFYYLRDSNARILALIIARHEEATFDLLNRHPNLDFGQNNRIRPASLSMVPSNVSPGRGVLVQGLRVAFAFRFMQYGL